MKNYRYLLLIFVMALLCNIRTEAQEPVSVFIVAGQSNADGRVFNTELPSYLKDGYEYLNYANVTDSCDGHFGKRTFENPKKRYAFCDITNYYIEQALKRDFYTVKCTYGGTAIDTAATYRIRPVWCADAEWLSENTAHRGKDTGKSLTKALIEGFDNCVDSTLSKISCGYDVKAILWHQGESDRAKASHYYDNFKTMITYMRNAIYAKTGKEKDKTLPFIFGTIAHNSKQYSAEVEAAQMRVAGELPNVYFVDMSKGQLGTDVLHFDAVGTEELGKKMYNKLVELDLVKGQQVAL